MKKLSNLVLAVLMLTTVSVTPLDAKPIVKKAIPVQQQAQGTTAKVVIADSDGSQNALVVLPPGFEHHDVIVADSAEYKKLLSDNKDLQAQVAAEKEWEGKYIDETTKVQQDQANALAAEQKKTSSIFSYFGWIKWIAGGGFITLIIGAIIVCVFFPAAIPLVEEWLVAFVRAIIKVFSDFAEVVSDLLKKKTTPPAK